MQSTTYTNPEVKIVDEASGICDYIASSPAMDADCEIVLPTGWLFGRMQKNGPFVNAHANGSIGNCLGKVIGAWLEGMNLVERVQWAIDVAENQLALLGWKMTVAKYLKAVSVGFLPKKLVTRLPGDEWPASWQGAMIANANQRQGKKVWDAVAEGLGDVSAVKTIYIEQEQTELSACIVGSNPDAVAKSLKTFAQAHKAGVLSDADLDLLSIEYASSVAKAMGDRETADSTVEPAVVEKARQRARMAFLVGLTTTSKRL